MLTGKKVLVLGGTGFVGSTISNLLAKCNADVYAFSRKGRSYQSALKIKSIHGDILKAEKHAQLINQMDIIVHSIGTLIDTSVTKFAKPGQSGTYEQVNRDTLLSVLKVLTTPKKIFYLSAYGQIPFIPKRYISTKLEAQKALLDSIHESYILKPGMIYSWKSKKITLPMKYFVDFSDNVLTLFLNNIPSQLSFPFKKYSGGQSTSLKDIAQVIAQISDNSVQDRLLFNKEIQQYSQKYVDSIITKGYEM